jgi:hypothetical protein
VPNLLGGERLARASLVVWMPNLRLARSHVTYCNPPGFGPKLKARRQDPVLSVNVLNDTVLEVGGLRSSYSI